jgi:hypothetical protein
VRQRAASVHEKAVPVGAADEVGSGDGSDSLILPVAVRVVEHGDD